MSKISILMLRLLQYCAQTLAPKCPTSSAIWVLGACCVCLSWSASKAQAEDLMLPPKDVDLVGQVRVVKVKHEDTLLDVARRYDLGLDAIVAANPTIDQWLPAKGDPDIILPTRYILPDAPRRGLVLNSPEKRLYYFPPAVAGKSRHVVTHPVSVGRMNWRTPIGITKVISKQIDPAWHPPASIRAEAVQKGTPLPAVVPAGPQNPLGKYAMRLAAGSGSYLIHGTDKAFGIGMQLTHGCMRLYPEDIKTLFKQVPVNTMVNIINQPIKLGWFANTLFIEITPPLEEDAHTRDNLMQITLKRIEEERASRPFKLDGAALERAITEQSGIPVAISQFEDL